MGDCWEASASLFSPVAFARILQNSVDRGNVLRYTGFTVQTNKEEVMKLRVGGIYRAKKPAQVGYGDVNDRQIIWMDATGFEVQYDSPAIPIGGKYKTCTVEDFIEWAGEDVSGKLPEGDWMKWETYKKAKFEGANK